MQRWTRAEPIWSASQHSRMLLDVLIPTLNRAKLLERAIESLLAAPVPLSLSVRITVIDNGCTDSTRFVVRRLAVAAA